MHIYNNKKKNFILIYLSKILEVSQDISFYFITIIENNNKNISFYLCNIMQAYVKITLNLNLKFYI